MKKAAILCYDWPSNNGGYNKSITSCINQYIETFDLTVFVFSDNYKKIDTNEYNIIHIPIKKRNQLRDFILSIFNVSPAVEWRYKSSYASIKKAVNCNEFEFLICQGILLGRAINYFNNIKKSVLMSHDCYQTAFNSIWKTKKFPYSIAWYIEEKKLKLFERNVVSKYDLMYAITSDDNSSYRASGIPCNGVFHRFPFINLQKYTNINENPLRASSLLTVGKIDDRKEVGTLRFINGVLQSLREDFPTLRYDLIGKYTDRFDNPEAGVYGHGFMQSCEEYYLKSAIFLNLQEQGAGIQFKVLDALSRRMIVICSEKSSTGLPPKLRKFVHIYSDSKSLYLIIKLLLLDKTYFNSSLNALKKLTMDDFFDSKMIGNNKEILHKIISLSN